MPDAFDATQIPAPRVPLIDTTTNLMSREWYRFFYNLYNLTGSGSNAASLTDVQLGPSDSQLSTENLVFLSELQGLAVSPANTPQLNRTRYGAFLDTTTQTAAAINTAYAISFNTTYLSLGVYTGSPTSRIYVDRPGIYDFQFSLQLESTNASAKNIFVWADINGSSVADSATKITLKGSNEAYVAAWNFVLKLNVGDYFRLMWSTSDTNVSIASGAASAPVPAIPSAILTVTNNIGA